MARITLSLSKIICILMLPLAVSGLPGSDGYADKNNWDEDLEVRLLARLLDARSEATAPIAAEKMPENGDRKSEDVETVQKMDSDRTKIDITSDNKLIEQHLLDCKKRYEIIVMNDDGTGKRKEACYLHRMEKTLHDTACQGNGQRVHQIYYIVNEIKDKDFLSKDGPENVCRSRTMYMISPANDLDLQDTPATRELSTGKTCINSCCRYGWWWTKNQCKDFCLKC